VQKMHFEAEDAELRELSSQVADPAKFARYKELMERRKVRSV
jgi:hypothetical protein